MDMTLSTQTAFETAAAHTDIFQKLGKCSPGMVAKHVSEAKKFLEQYLDYLGIERDKEIQGFSGAGRPRTKLQWFNYVFRDANKTIQSCYKEDEEAEDDAPKVENTAEDFGKIVMLNASQFKNLFLALIAASEMAKIHFTDSSLESEDQKRFPFLTATRAESLLNQLHLSQMYCAFSGYLEQYKRNPTASADKLNKPLRMHTNAFRYLIQVLKKKFKNPIFTNYSPLPPRTGNLDSKRAEFYKYIFGQKPIGVVYSYCGNHWITGLKLGESFASNQTSQQPKNNQGDNKATREPK